MSCRATGTCLICSRTLDTAATTRFRARAPWSRCTISAMPFPPTPFSIRSWAAAPPASPRCLPASASWESSATRCTSSMPAGASNRLGVPFNRPAPANRQPRQGRAIYAASTNENDVLESRSPARALRRRGLRSPLRRQTLPVKRQPALQPWRLWRSDHHTRYRLSDHRRRPHRRKGGVAVPLTHAVSIRPEYLSRRVGRFATADRIATALAEAIRRAI